MRHMALIIVQQARRGVLVLNFHKGDRRQQGFQGCQHGTKSGTRVELWGDGSLVHSSGLRLEVMISGTLEHC